MENWCLEDEHQGGNNQAADDGSVETVATDVAGSFIAALTKETGDHRTTAETEDIPDGDHQREDRGPLRDSGN